MEVLQTEFEDLSLTQTLTPHALTDAALVRSETLLAELVALDLTDSADMRHKRTSPLRTCTICLAESACVPRCVSCFHGVSIMCP